MTALTVADIGIGYFLIGAALLILGPLTIWCAKRDLKAEQRRIHPSFGNRPEQLAQQETAAAPFAHTLDDGHNDYDLALAKHTADGLARLEMAVDVAVLANPRTVLWAMPQQRRPFDVETEGL